MPLGEYRKKRDFKKTAEPSGKVGKKKARAAFVVQKHSASHLHYDFRLEANGVLKSWAIPKGPSLDPKDKRLAMLVEDHPLDYASFEGSIPKGSYGAGEVIVWDRGTYDLSGSNSFKEAFKKGDIKINLKGEKLRGEFVLARMKSEKENTWLLIKKQDEYAGPFDVLKDDRSVISGRRLDSGKDPKQPVAPRSEMPRDVRPMLANSISSAFDRDGWIFEIKWDGYRAIAEVEKGSVRLYSRRLKDFGSRYRRITEGLSVLGHDVVLDGEIVALDDGGRPRFQYLQNWDESPKGTLIYCVFDILYKDGLDLRGLPLIQRKEVLRGIVDGIDGLFFSDYAETRGMAFFEAAKKLGLEGIMAKDSSGVYREGIRSDSWLKIKTEMRQEAVIAGFTEPRGGRHHIGALVLGVYEHGGLVYIGHTGGGFDEKILKDLHAKLQPIKIAESPFLNTPKTNAPVTWVKPELVCEVKFQEWTDDGHMRQPVFIGMRDDKSARDVTRETEINKAANDSERGLLVEDSWVKLTNLDKIFWPEEGYTKGDLIDYYRKIAPYILPYIEGRPQSMQRHPNGIDGGSFFQKNVDHSVPPWARTAKIHSESEERDLNYLICDNEPTLLYMANLGCIELNPWLSKVESLDNPDYAVLDLDPEGISFEEVVRAAIEIKKILDASHIPSFCKTSGATGLHILVPMGAKYTYEQVRNFSEIIMRIVQKRLPETTSVERSPNDRKNKVYLDYLQNRRGQTIASPYCLRPRPGAPVSTPLEWKEVKKGLDPSVFTIQTIFNRLKKKGDVMRPLLSESVDLGAVLDSLMQ